MFQITSVPDASHVLFQKALSPIISTLSLVSATSLSKSFALTSIFSFSVKRFAVSLTTANAFGNISNRTSSRTTSDSFSKVSISRKICSFSSMAVLGSVVFFFSVEILSSISLRPSLIFPLSTGVIALNSSFESSANFVCSTFAASTKGCNSLRSF